MTSTSSPLRRSRSRVVPCAVVATVAAIVAASACGVADNNSNGTSSGAPLRSSMQGSAAEVPAGGAAGSGSLASGYAQDKGAGPADVSALSLDRAQIKKAQIGLRSAKVASVVAAIETIAASQGGYVDSENTATDSHGAAASSAITLRVPVDAFAATVDQVAQLARLQSKKTTTVDVTGQVADVASRVSSAKDSIAQLRVLFSHATKLADIIALESELSSRESDLEALEAQQRVLTAQTSLSTIAVYVTRDPAPPPPSPGDDSAGFLGGLRQGWDALGTAFQSTAHALGAVLPIGLTLSALGLLAWAAVRRLPRRRTGTSG
ncbi:MAG: DUF4349 domain-containing protein [Nocardioidaceae bacterium]